MDSNKNNTKIKVLMFPWLAYGHITPYLELAKKLSTRNFITYLCSTSATLSCIEKNITPKWSESIKLVPLNLPILPNLPKHLHTTNGLPHHLMPKLKQSLNMSEPEFSNILVKIKPDLLIYDFLQPWAPISAKPHNIPSVLFITSSSTSTSFMFHYFNNPSIDTVFPYSNIYYRDYEHHKMKDLLEIDPEEKESVCEAFGRSNNIVLIKGFREIEGKYIDYVSSLIGKKFVPVGPLVQEPVFNNNEDSNDIFSWLETKELKSTIFISFGSEYFLSKEDMDEIAYGLELSEVNFIWVLRFPKCVEDPLMHKNKAQNLLPLGFVQRVGNKGKIVEGWAPQTKILGHRNVGGFVSHCGWNSVMESMNYGVPIIAVPMHLDQPLNARLVEEVGVGIEAVRDENNRLNRDSLAKAIKDVVVEDCGEFVRKKAGEMRDKIKEDGDQETDEVVKELVALCSKN